MTDCLEKGKSRRETLIYAFPLYINGNTQLVYRDEQYGQIIIDF